MSRDDAPVTDTTDRCAHPVKHVFAWVAYDGTLCAGCCACGEVLAGAAEPLEHPEHTGQLLGECDHPRSE